MRPGLTVRLVVFLSWMIEARAANITATEAVVIPPSEYFEGNDGPWSSFFVRVGTPEQSVRVLVATASPETLVVQSDFGCSSSVFTTVPVPADCAVSRGVLFNPNDSSTWHDLGTYGINQDGVGLEANLGYTQRANFALDNLGVGTTGPKLSNQTIAGIATPEPFYLGIFGLNTQPVNFSSLGNSTSPSFLTNLKDQGMIPSLSWSYTAGAQYRLKRVYGQLILSGYDTSRFDTGNSVSFTMARDVTRDLVVALQSIRYSGATQATLLSSSIFIMIDSTDPNLWLPDSVCDAFEQAFGLTLDKTSGLYLINDTHHAALLDSKAEVTFRLSDVNSGGDIVSITLPYRAFDLTVGPPLVASSSHYFPLKRAANATQYTLGRTFLQEAYLSADYERGVFNVSACTWDEGAKENIITINPKNSSTNGGSGADGSQESASASLSNGTIAGIVVGCVALAVILAALIVALFFFRRRRKTKALYAATDPEPDDDVINGPVFNATYPSVFGTEPTLPSQEQSNGSLVAGTTHSSDHSPGNELDGEDTHIRPTAELDGTEIKMMPGQKAPRSGTKLIHELAGTDAEMNEPDGVSTVGTLASREDDLVSPSSPVLHRFSRNTSTHHTSEPSL